MRSEVISEVLTLVEGSGEMKQSMRLLAAGLQGIRALGAAAGSREYLREPFFSSS